MDDRSVSERRRVLGVLGAGVVLAGCGGTQARGGGEHGEHGEHGEGDADAGVTAPEDLMREHGVLQRVLLVYEECARRLRAGAALDASQLARAARIVRTFVEDYHERSEERWVFPVVRTAPGMAPVVDALLAQHQRGRQVTDEVIRRAQQAPTAGAGAAQLAELLEGFARMYRPHAAREDTVIFPTLRRVAGRRRVDEMGEQMEEAEHSTVGEGGFERAVDEVAGIERALGLDDLARFTPPAPTAPAAPG